MLGHPLNVADHRLRVAEDRPVDPLKNVPAPGDTSRFRGDHVSRIDVSFAEGRDREDISVQREPFNHGSQLRLRH